MASPHADGVVRCPKSEYGDAFATDLLEQYKVYVGSAESVSARRIASSRLLLALNAGLVALYGFAPAGFGEGLWAMPVPLLGVIVCLLWYSIIKSHRDLNRVKFKIIHELEQHLPATPYTREWQLAEQGRGGSYRAVTDVERWIPWTFLVLHGVLLLGSALEAATDLSMPPGR